jgi:hypothetical protein
MESDEKLKNTVIEVKISGDGAKMTGLTSFSILNTEDTVVSSKVIFHNPVSLVDSFGIYLHTQT